MGTSIPARIKPYPAAMTGCHKPILHQENSNTLPQHLQTPPAGVPGLYPSRQTHHTAHTRQIRPSQPAPARPPSPASHLWSPARQARPPPEREARRCSLMARAGERSHHGGGTISPRPAGAGSQSLGCCSVTACRVGWLSRAARHWPGTSGVGAVYSPVPLSQSRPSPPPLPDTCGHRQLLTAKTKHFLEGDRALASFPHPRGDSHSLHIAHLDDPSIPIPGGLM